MKIKLGLLAKDIHNSVLPRTYEFFGKSLGLAVDFTIHNVALKQLDETVKIFKNTLNGFTVTMPYKVKILDYCDQIDESAEKCGSANTILVKNKKMYAYNTDGWGMIKCLTLKGHSFCEKRIVLVGAGGVGLSIAYNLSINAVTRVDVLNPFEEETKRLTSKMGPRFEGHLLTNEALCTFARNTDYFINASVLGQLGYDDYEDLSFLDYMTSEAIVFDVNYSNSNAKLPMAASAKGLKVYVGKAMSSCQGIRAMEIWTGRMPTDDTARELLGLIEGEG